MPEIDETSTCKHDGTPAVGYVPVNNGFIYVCGTCFDSYQRRCFWVVRFGEDENGSAATRFEHHTWRKHKQLRGSRDLMEFSKRPTEPAAIIEYGMA